MRLRAAGSWSCVAGLVYTYRIALTTGIPFLPLSRALVDLRYPAVLGRSARLSLSTSRL